MRRVVAAVLLLAAAVSLSVWSGITFKKEMESLSYSLEELLICPAEERESKTDKLITQWNASSKLLHSLVVHEGMDELEEVITSLPLTVGHSTDEEFKNKCIEAVNLIKNLLESEKLDIGNIL